MTGGLSENKIRHISAGVVIETSDLIHGGSPRGTVGGKLAVILGKI